VNSSPAATVALIQLELEVLDRLAGNKPITSESSKALSAYLVKIARPGGILGRANDPPPGNIAM